jgi:hypothetical protein
MKAWAVGPGGQGYTNNGAGGTAYKTWSVSSGNTITYAIGVPNSTNTTVTFSGTTITGNKGEYNAGGSFSGGDGGAAGGFGTRVNNIVIGGAVGGNTVTAYRYAMTDVSGLKAALSLAGAKTVEDNTATPAFGSGVYTAKAGLRLETAGRGGAGASTGWANPNGGGGAVVLYFT